MNSQLHEVSYTPESLLRHPGRLIVAMLKDVRASRGLAWRLFVRDISAMYRQSILGYAWAFLPPLVAALPWVFLSAQKILQLQATSVPYPVYVMVGMMLWQTFMDALNSPLKQVTAARGMLTKINFPREALILAGLAEVMFNFAVRLLLLVPVYLWFPLPLGTVLLLAPVGVLGLILLGLALGLLITPAAMLYSDLARGISLASGFWMLLTPVVYPPPTTKLGALLAHWNPVSPVLLTARDWFTGAPATHLSGFILVACGSFVLLLAAWVLYRLTMPILVERMGA